MAVCEIRFVRRLLVPPRAVVGARLSMVLCGVRKMLGRFSVMLDCFGRHGHASSEIRVVCSAALPFSTTIVGSDTVQNGTDSVGACR
jgi:hypothetical protein